MTKNNYLNMSYEEVLYCWQTYPAQHPDLKKIKAALRPTRRREGRLIIGACFGDNRHERRKKRKLGLLNEQ